VCNDDGRMMIAQYVGKSIWQWQYKYTNYDVDVWDDEEQGPVCWWMPLPEPPKEQKKRIKDHVCNNDYCELE